MWSAAYIFKPFKIFRSSCGGGGGSEGDQGGWKVSSGKTTNLQICSKHNFENNLDFIHQVHPQPAFLLICLRQGQRGGREESNQSLPINTKTKTLPLKAKMWVPVQRTAEDMFVDMGDSGPAAQAVQVYFKPFFCSFFGCHKKEHIDSTRSSNNNN